MLPAAFVFLDTLPLTPNGKVDRKALPAPSLARGADSFVPPQTPMEQALAAVFSATLGVPQVGRHDDFFALGGDSLLAVRAVYRAQQAGISLTVKQLFGGSSLAKLAASLTGTGRSTCILQFQEGKGSGAIVMVPPAGGLFFRGHEIARALAVSTPIYGMISPFLAGDPSPPETIDGLADLYAREIVDRVPTDPIVLIGYSLGGSIAVEVAHHLLRRGRVVESVVLLDSGAPSQATPEEFDELAVLAILLEAMGGQSDRLAGLGPQEARMEVAAAMAPSVQEAQGVLSLLEAILESWKCYQNARDFRPQLPPVPIHLLRVEREDSLADLGWGEFGTLASVQLIPGQHLSILRAPYLPTTAQAISRLLAKKIP
jgi:thioesterase domain-containing protein